MPELTDLVRMVAENHPKAQPHEIADIVAEMTEPEDLERFYLTALRPFVGSYLSTRRNAVLNSGTGQQTEEVAPTGKAVRPDNWSAKREKCRDWWARMCQERIRVADEWKQLGDCTVEDFTFCIDLRNQKIASIQIQNEKYEKIVAAMLEHGVEVAKDLPSSAVQL